MDKSQDSGALKIVRCIFGMLKILVYTMLSTTLYCTFNIMLLYCSQLIESIYNESFLLLALRFRTNNNIVGHILREVALVDHSALLWFLTCYLIVAAVRQHRIGQPWLGPTRACADFTDFKKTAISQKLSHL